MTFDWTEYFRLAEELVGRQVRPAVNEARERSAISREYYAAFCLARATLIREGDTTMPSGGQVHHYVALRLQESDDPKRRRLGVNLDRLRLDRRRVDYDEEVRGLDRMVEADLASAREIVEAMGLPAQGKTGRSETRDG